MSVVWVVVRDPLIAATLATYGYTRTALIESRSAVHPFGWLEGSCAPVQVPNERAIFEAHKLLYHSA